MNIIAIDGPGGVGKSSVSRLLAERLGYYFLSTGLLYRALAWWFLEAGWQSTQAPPLERLAALALEIRADGALAVNGKPIQADLHQAAISDAASRLSTQAPVRDAINMLLRELVEAMARQGRFPGVILEGRDMGTVVFPGASHKFFLTASAHARARRRHLEMAGNAAAPSFEETLNDLEERDRRDSTREVAPLKPAGDAMLVDTSSLGLEEVVQVLSKTIRSEPTLKNRG